MLRFVDTGVDDEQEPQKTSGNEQELAVKSIVMYEDEPDPSPAKITRYCTHILTKGARKGEQCRFRASDKTSKCYHYKKS